MYINLFLIFIYPFIQLSDGSCLKVHLILLAGHSRLFSKAIIRNKKDIDGSFFDANAVRQMINFLYTGNLKFKLIDIPDLFSISEIWELNYFKEILEEILRNESNRSTFLIHCINILNTKKFKISLPTKKAIIKNAVENLKNLFLDPRIIDVDFNSIKEILEENVKHGNAVDTVGYLLTYLKPGKNRKFTNILLKAISSKNINIHDRQLMIEKVRKELGNKSLETSQIQFNISLSGRHQQANEDYHAIPSSRHILKSKMEDMKNPFEMSDHCGNESVLMVSVFHS